MVYIQHLIDEPRAWQRPVSKVYDANRVSGEFYYRVIKAFFKMVFLKYEIYLKVFFLQLIIEGIGLKAQFIWATQHTIPIVFKLILYNLLYYKNHEKGACVQQEI